MSRWNIEPHPYVDLDLDQLAEVGRNLRARLAAAGPHTPESRKQLAADLDSYLATAIYRLSPGHYKPNEPETELMMGAETTVAGAFGGMYRAGACRLRNQAMERAASLVLGDQFERYLRAGMPGQTPGTRAWNSEDGLMDELRKLDVVQPRKNEKKRP